MFPQARKHCRNGGAGTDCDWDNKQYGNEKDRQKKVKRDKKTREIEKSEEDRIRGIKTSNSS